jgi:propionyl-CoA carboxylase alpha chain
MGEAAVNAAKAANYYNAGTIEFILDEKLNFYFLEMNTRLQVEHPVTEQITGLDLVKLQIQIAEGAKLPFKQEDLKINGHAIEVRVYAEDPTNNFLPDIGILKTYKRPQGHGIRVDDGFEQGMAIPFYYDPMIAKMICHDETRERAIEKTIRAINEYEITGVETTLGFCNFVMHHESFRSGNFSTKFVESYLKPEYLKGQSTPEEEMIACALAAEMISTSKQPYLNNNGADGSAIGSKWKKNRLV